MSAFTRPLRPVSSRGLTLGSSPSVLGPDQGSPRTPGCPHSLPLPTPVTNNKGDIPTPLTLSLLISFVTRQTPTPSGLE